MGASTPAGCFLRAPPLSFCCGLPGVGVNCSLPLLALELYLSTYQTLPKRQFYMAICFLLGLRLMLMTPFLTTFYILRKHHLWDGQEERGWGTKPHLLLFLSPSPSAQKVSNPVLFPVAVITKNNLGGKKRFIFTHNSTLQPFVTGSESGSQWCVSLVPVLERGEKGLGRQVDL